MTISSLLDQPCLSLISPEIDGELARVRAVVSRSVVVEDRMDIEAVLGALAAVGRPGIPKYLDLIGHSSPDHSLFMLGGWPLDARKLKVTAFFRGLAECEILPRIGVHTLRLLGCETATTEIGRYTLTALSEILGVDVIGTTTMIGASHYDANGFRVDQGHLLVSARDLCPAAEPIKRGGEPYQRTLDIDALPSSPLGAPPSWPRHVVDLATARQIFQLVRRTDGAQMLGLLSAPQLELALPSGKSGWYHRVQVVLDGSFVRVYPDGEDRPGVLFPVANAHELIRLATMLPRG